MKISFKKFKLDKQPLVFYTGNERLVFFPAVIFIFLGLMALVAPKLLLAVVASFFVFVGLLCAFLAWKFIQLRRKVEKVVKDLKGSIVIQGYQGKSPFESEESPEDIKKIILH